MSGACSDSSFPLKINRLTLCALSQSASFVLSRLQIIIFAVKLNFRTQQHLLNNCLYMYTLLLLRSHLKLLENFVSLYEMHFHWGWRGSTRKERMWKMYFGRAAWKSVHTLIDKDMCSHIYMRPRRRYVLKCY